MIYYLILLTGLISTLIASISDIKTREVPDWLSFSLLSAALGIRLIYSLTTNNWKYFIYAVIISAILFGIGISLYYLKQWGGGDVKLLAALGALFGYFPQKEYFIFYFIAILLITGALYGIVYSIFLAVKHREKFKKQSLKILNRHKKIRITILISLIVVAISLLTPLSQNIKFTITIFFVTMTLYFYIYILIKSVEETCMYRKVNPSQLKEEDWIAEDIHLKNKIIKKTIPGLTKEHISLIKSSKIKTIKIKEGIPFVPSFFIATIITIIVTQFF